MKNPVFNRLLKLLTISCFVILMAGFVTFKSGVFDKKENRFNQSLYVGKLNVDTPPPNKTMIMSSSKSAIAIEPSINFTQIPQDSFRPYKEVMPSSKSLQLFNTHQLILMGSSKSSILFNPPSKVNIKSDAVKDSIRSKVRNN